MRYVHPNLEALLATEGLSAFYMVEIVTPFTTSREVTLPYDVTLPGVGTFLATTSIFKLESPRLSDVVDRETYKIFYIDTDKEKLAWFESVLTGSKVTVRLGFINTSGASIAGFAPGSPILNVDYTIIAYKGTVDTHGLTIEPEQGSIVATIECSSPVAALGMSKSFMTSKEGMKRFDPNDTAFDQSFASGAKLLWGKA